MLRELHDALRDAGLPITGLAGDRNRINITGWEVADPQPEQVALAHNIIAGFEWEDLEPTLQQGRALVALLDDAQRKRVLDQMMASWIVARPRLFRQLENEQVGAASPVRNK